MNEQDRVGEPSTVDELDLRTFSETTAFVNCVVYLMRGTALFGCAEMNPATLGTRQVSLERGDAIAAL
jgi:hypothetical protein